jgi:hypothetical protein
MGDSAALRPYRSDTGRSVHISSTLQPSCWRLRRRCTEAAGAHEAGLLPFIRPERSALQTIKPDCCHPPTHPNGSALLNTRADCCHPLPQTGRLCLSQGRTAATHLHRKGDSADHKTGLLPPTHSLTHPPIHSFTTHPPTHPPTHSLTHSLTHSFTHSLTLSH